MKGGAVRMNRKGDIPTILLFIVCLALVVIALFSFASFKGGFVKDSEGRNELLSRIEFYEDYVVKKSTSIGGGVIRDLVSVEFNDANLEKKFKEIALERNFGILGLENYYGKILRGEFYFVYDGKRFRFEMKDLFIEAENGANKVRRNFGFGIEFDKNGEIKKEQSFEGSFSTGA